MANQKDEKQDFKLVFVEEVPTFEKNSETRAIVEGFQNSKGTTAKIENFPKASVGYLRDTIKKLKLNIGVNVRGDTVYLVKNPVKKK